MAFRATSPSGQKDFVGDLEGVQMIAARYKAARNVDLQIVAQECIVFDGGGACMVGEPDVEFSAAGLSCKAPISQVPFLLEALEHAKPYKGTNCIVFGGWMGFYYAISLQARDALVGELKNLEPGIRAKSEAWELQIKESLAKAGVLDIRKPMP